MKTSLELNWLEGMAFESEINGRKSKKHLSRPILYLQPSRSHSAKRPKNKCRDVRSPNNSQLMGRS